MKLNMLGKFASNISNMSLVRKFNIVYFIVVVIPISILGLYIYHITYMSTIYQVEKSIEQEVYQVKENILLKVNLTEEFAKTLAYNKKITDFLNDTYNRTANDVIYYNTEIVPLTNQLFAMKSSLYNSLTFYYDNDSIPEVWDYFRSIRTLDKFGSMKESIRNEKKFIWWQMDDVHKNNSTSCFLKMKSYDLKKNIAILELSMPDKILFDALNKNRMTYAGEICIIDKNYKVLVNLNRKSYLPNTILPVDTHGEINGSNLQYISKADKADSIITIRMIEGLDMYIASITPLSSFDSSLKKIRVEILITLIIVFAVLFFVISFINFNLLKRLKVLLNEIKLIREGHLKSNVTVSSNDEIGELTRNFNSMTERIENLVDRICEVKAAEKEAELRALEAQINPHFLFNALSSISWVAKAYKNYKVVEMTNALARFYRFIMDNEVLVTDIKSELENLEAYLMIQNTRFNGMFNVFYDIDPGFSDCRILKLILQPIIENALSHGIAPKMVHGTIIIRLEERAGNLVFQIIDDGVGIPEEVLQKISKNQRVGTKSGGYAIKNLNDRLRIYYSEEYGVSVYSKRGIGTTVEICFPKAI